MLKYGYLLFLFPVTGQSVRVDPEADTGRRPSARFSNRALFTNAWELWTWSQSEIQWGGRGSTSENRSHGNRGRDVSARPWQEREWTSESLEAHFSAGGEFGAVWVSIQMVWAIAVSPGGMIHWLQVTEAGGQVGEAWSSTVWVTAVISQERPAFRCHG